ncbi:MAG: hypothetical protein LBC85_10470 [Fibromonadaceae bacterium]|jgi:hypothetical protein|nr:hypothetical protein [Fibromonadaceae bacterium]
MANEVLMRISREEEERIRIMSEEKFILDRHCERVYGRKELEKKLGEKLKKMNTKYQTVIANANTEIARLRKLVADNGLE